MTTDPGRRLRLLFFKRKFSWPRSSGHDVHVFYMMQALAALGHEIGLVTLQESDPKALDGLPLALHQTLGGTSNGSSIPSPGGPPSGSTDASRQAPLPSMTWLQERFRSFFGAEPARLAALTTLIDDFRADALIAGGLDILPYFPAARRTVSVWYAADELTLHHLSLLQLNDRRTWSQTKEAAFKALYERAFRSAIDRAWVVSSREAQAMRWFAGMRAVDIVPNGVDTELYKPRDLPETPRTAVFWGRLDFEPNVQALEWFCGHIWPHVHKAYPDARFTIIGFQPIDEVKALAGRNNVELLPDLPDIRDEVARRAVVVLPFVSGGGIKNKLLEAASLGKAIVCTPRACSGLRQGDAAPFRRATQPAEWVKALGELWDQPDERRRVGTDARAWVLAHHTWAATAAEAVIGLKDSLSRRA
jgi:glycosyltransferase involved in cell wall biosynthesis